MDHNPVLIAAARVPGGHPGWVCADLTEPGLAPGSVEVVRTERVPMYVPDLAAAVGPRGPAASYRACCTP